MAHALALAENAIGLSDPNPRVGCVLVAADGRWIGAGFTQQAGGPHAEVMALRDAAARAADTRGATAYVTLEPCSHHGRTPPCCDALLAAGIGRVVVAASDPNPQVNGQGVARLRAAGVAVDFAGAQAESASRELNIGFFQRMRHGRPWVRMKIAASLDGRTALDNGASQWITGAAARHDGHAWRRRASVLLTGSGTLLADDPRLDVRGHAVACPPARWVLDSRLRIPPTARLFDAPGAVWLACAEADADRAAALQARGAQIWSAGTRNGLVDLEALLAELARQQVNELHVEAGARLNAGLLAGGWVDELLLYQAPLLLGSGRPMAALGPYADLSEGLRFVLHDAQPVGADLRLRLRRPA